MKFLLLLPLLLWGSTSFSQYNKYEGTIEGALFENDKIRLNSNDTIFFIQGSRTYSTTPIFGKFYLDFEYILEEPFSVHFVNLDCIRKTIYFDLSEADTAEIIRDGYSLVEFPAIKIDMAKTEKDRMIQLSVADFYWKEDLLLLDLWHNKHQNEFLEKWSSNKDSIFMQHSFNLDSSMVYKVGDSYRPDEIIRFKGSKTVIHKKSMQDLDEVASFLLDHPNFIIEVGVHGEAGLIKSKESSLTKERADNIVEYLVAKGVRREQLMAVGYKDSNPLYSSLDLKAMSSNKERKKANQLSQRTEFTIISLFGSLVLNH